jgi:hypothetical protein
MTHVQKRAREAVVRANHVATRLEQTAVQKEARAKGALAHVSTIQQVVAMEQQTLRQEKAYAQCQTEDVTLWSRTFTQHKLHFRSSSNKTTQISVS